jgi:hypothetical protein
MARKCLLSLDFDPQPLGCFQNSLWFAPGLFYDACYIRRFGKRDYIRVRRS